jgi:hypothetical protein
MIIRDVNKNHQNFRNDYLLIEEDATELKMKIKNFSMLMEEVAKDSQVKQDQKNSFSCSFVASVEKNTFLRKFSIKNLAD